MITIVSGIPLVIGQTYGPGLTDAFGNYSEVAFLVVSESTKEKYLQCLKEHGSEEHHIGDSDTFYDILVD